MGNYAETLTVSGGNDTIAQVALSFSVVEAAPDTYILTVNLNGGSGSTIGGEYAEGAVVDIDAGSRSNYRFDGWTSSNGGTFADASSASTTFTMPAGRWVGWSCMVAVKCFSYTQSTSPTIPRPARVYEFTGWYADEDLTEKITSIRLTRNTTRFMRAGKKSRKIQVQALKIRLPMFPKATGFSMM